MLFYGKFGIQPKKDVLLARQQPTKIFAKLFHNLTAGLLLPSEKHQTFTAIAILQQLNVAMRRAGITNIVKLAKDGNDFYHDNSAKPDDLPEAMKAFEQNTDSAEKKLFEDLNLVLEHDDGVIRYLIEIDVKRVHRADELPIVVTVNGVIGEFAQGQNESSLELKRRMRSRFSDDASYQAYLSPIKVQFERFFADLGGALRQAIRSETFTEEHCVQLLRPGEQGVMKVNDQKTAPLPYRGYRHWEYAAIYTFLWMPMLSEAEINPGEVDVINDTGDVLASLTPEVDLSDSVLWDMSVGNDALSQIKDRSFDGGIAGGSSDSGSSWLDFGSDSSDGGSSCSSGCGGGCGS